MSDDELERLRAENEQLKAALAGREQGTSASAPPHASAKAGLAVLIGVALLVLLVVATCRPATEKSEPLLPAARPEQTAVAPAATDAAGATQPHIPTETSASPWRYDEDEDPMGGVTKTACVTSKDTVSLSWPYQAQRMQFCIRRSPKFGLDAYTALEGDGQILCNSYSRCHIRVRFDDQTARSWPGAEAADGSSNIVFLNRTQTLVTNLKSAKRLRVELEFYQNGLQSVEYDVNGLEW